MDLQTSTASQISPRYTFSVWSVLGVSIIVCIALLAGFYAGSLNRGVDSQSQASVVQVQPPSKDRYVYANLAIDVATYGPIPKDWIKKEYPDWGYSVMIPPNWRTEDITGKVSQMNFYNPTDTHDAVDISYDYPGFASTDQTIEERAQEQLFDVFPTTIDGEQGYRGVFSNQSLWLAEMEIYVAHNGVTYTISPGSSPSDTVLKILSSITFLR